MPFLSASCRAALALLLSFAVALAHAQDPPETLVAGIIGAVGEAIRRDAQALGGQAALPAAVAIINRTVAPHMDFAAITREAAGRHWAGASPEQRASLEREFRQLLVHVLARLLLTNRGDVLETQPGDAGPAAREALVRVAVTRPRAVAGQPPPAMQVTLRRQDAGAAWRIHELRTDGVDIVKLYSANFEVVIERNGGIDGLIRALAERNLLNAGVVLSKPRPEPAD